MSITPPGDAAQFAAWMREMERRMAALETTRTARFLSIADDDGNIVAELNGNGLTFTDASGQRRILLGDLSTVNPDLDYGISIEDGDGGDRLIIDGDGFQLPYLHSSFRVLQGITYNNVYATVTAGSFTGVFRTAFQMVSHKGMAVDIVVVSDVGTAGEIRLSNNAGNSTAAAVTSSTSTISYRWEHGASLGSGPYSFTIEARRTSGAGNVYVYLPGDAALVSPLICTAGGL